MAQLYTKVKKYLEANSKTWDAEQNNIVLQNDGSGDYIHTWNVSGLSKPSDSQIASYETAGNTQETLNGVLNKRAREYKQLKEQLDLLYHDMVADKGDKTGEWFKHIKAVKDANPKE
tara:strand:+ start:180 stop:530 length:351 start_codon:yes stop_codon:yes gene_type:complete